MNGELMKTMSKSELEDTVKQGLLADKLLENMLVRPSAVSKAQAEIELLKEMLCRADCGCLSADCRAHGSYEPDKLEYASKIIGADQTKHRTHFEARAKRELELDEFEKRGYERIYSVFRFPNGALAVCNEKHEQIGRLQDRNSEEGWAEICKMADDKTLWYGGIPAGAKGVVGT